jgi:hypothetical protein
MHAHTLALRELRRRELLEEAAREQLLDQHCPSMPIAVSDLRHRVGQRVRHIVVEARMSRLAPRVAAHV